MQKTFKRKLLPLVVGIFLMILTLLTVPASAQEPTPLASGATQTSKPSATPTPTSPSNTELKKTLDRALDKVEAQQQVIEAKDEVIEVQDKALITSETVSAERKAEADALRVSLEKQKNATVKAEEGWQAEEKRTRELEKKLRKSDSKVKWMAAGGVLVAVAVFLLK